jgi:hypothetical protein
MKVYVAGGWLEKDMIVAPMIKRLRDAGVTITHDWTDAGPSVDNVEAHVKHEDTLSPDVRKKHADQDLQGVYDCDFLWFIVPGYKGSAGSWTEFGFALAQPGRCMRTVVSGPWQKSIFCELADYKFATHEEALQFLLKVKW